MKDFWKDCAVGFGVVLIALIMGGCLAITLVQHGYIPVETTNSSNVPDEFLVTENDIEKIRYEGKKDAEELIERMESNEKKEKEILATAEAKVKAGIPLNTEERDVFVRKIHLEEFHKIMEKH